MSHNPISNKLKHATRLIILDRDGVINRDLGTYVTTPDEFEFLTGSIEAIARLKQAGFLIAIATNQAGIERQFYTHAMLSAIHAQMLLAIRRGGGDIDRIVYCPSYDDAHAWRKPNAGMLTEILNGFNMSAHNSIFVGDSLRDMQAGKTVGCQLMKITEKNTQNTATSLNQHQHDARVSANSTFDDVPVFKNLLAIAEKLAP